MAIAIAAQPDEPDRGRAWTSLLVSTSVHKEGKPGRDDAGWSLRRARFVIAEPGRSLEHRAERGVETGGSEEPPAAEW